MDNSYIVYKHTAPNGKAYIGITKTSIERRANYNGSGYKACPAFYSAILKYGWESFKHEILFTGLTQEQAEKKEIELIAELRTNRPHNGYNIENGGNITGTHSEETKRKMSEAQKGRKYPYRVIADSTREKHRLLFTEHNPQKGKPLTEAQKQAISKANKGRLAGANHHKARAVRCTTTGTIYRTVKEAGAAIGVSYMCIIQSIQGLRGRKYAGKIGDTPLQWEYHEIGEES